MLTCLHSFLRLLSRDEKGVTAIEYGLIAALISLMLVTGASLAGESLSTMFTNISTQLSTAVGASS